MPAPTITDLITADESGVEAAATGAEVGDLFEYRIDQPITVRRDSSALIPIRSTVSAFELEPRKTAELVVTERRALMENYDVSNLTPSQVELFVARRYIDDATRAALDRIIGIKGQIAAADARLAAADRETAEIAADQSRLRENIKVLSEKTEARQLVARYVSKANEQETRLEQILSERKAAAAERARLQSDLDSAIRALAVDRKL